MTFRAVLTALLRAKSHQLPQRAHRLQSANPARIVVWRPGLEPVGVRDEKVGGSNPLTPIVDKDPAPAAGSLSMAESRLNLRPPTSPKGEDASEVHAERQRGAAERSDAKLLSPRIDEEGGGDARPLFIGLVAS